MNKYEVSLTSPVYRYKRIYYSAVESKKLQEHLTIEKNKTNDSITQDKNSSQSVAGSVLVDLAVI